MSNTWAYNRNTVRQKDNISAFDREYERNEGEKPDQDSDWTKIKTLFLTASKRLALASRGPTSGISASCDFVILLDFSDAIPSSIIMLPFSAIQVASQQ